MHSPTIGLRVAGVRREVGVAIPVRTAVAWRLITLLDRAPVLQQPPEKVRTASNHRRALLRIPGAGLVVGRTHPGASTRDATATLQDGTRLAVRVYRPRGRSGRLPVVVNFHGGGFVSGDIRQSEWWCSSIAAKAGVVVVSVEYRLAPEHPFPAPVDDCYAATEWIVEHAGDLDVDPTRLAVMGDSAGANLAAVVCLLARDRSGPAIALQVLVYPPVDMAREFLSERENANAPVLQLADHENAPRLYIHGTDADLADPRISPLRADHHDLPPALIQTAQHDILRDHGAVYADALRAAGVPVQYTNYPDAVHGFISLPGIVPDAARALAEAVATVRGHLRP